MSIREDIAAALTERLDPTRYAVIPYPYNPDLIPADKRPVSLWVASVDRDLTLRVVRFRIVVWVLSPHADPSAGTEADLELSFSDVLDALHTSNPAWTWTTATRGVLDDQWNGYRFDVTAVATITTPTT